MSNIITSQLFNITKSIDKIISDSKSLKVVSKDIVVKASEGIFDYSIVVAPTKPAGSTGSLTFTNINLRRLSVLSSPGFVEQKYAISKINSGPNQSLVLDPRKLDKDAQTFNIRFAIECDIEKVVSDLVRRDRQVDARGQEVSTYWLSAQLKDPSTLGRLLRRVDMEDVPFIVNVAIHQDVKTKFPVRRRRELELIADWARELHTGRKLQLGYKHIELKRAKPKEKEITKVLEDLQRLFVPNRFKSFVEVLRDFYYSDCFRGAEFYDQVPFRTFPKWMSVTCRTDLSLDNPASQGELVYKKAEFQEAIEKALSEK